MRKIENKDLNRLSIEEFAASEKTPIIVIADNIRSLNNIGSLFRTCDAFAVEALYLCGISATPPNKEIHKTALGAENSVSWSYFNTSIEAAEKLKNERYKIVSVEQIEGSYTPDKFPFDKGAKYALVLGNEVNGVSQQIVDISDYALELPQYGTKHSLNVSVCGGIVIWEFFKMFK